jgi:hypothetical protein
MVEIEKKDIIKNKISEKDFDELKKLMENPNLKKEYIYFTGRFFIVKDSKGKNYIVSKF